MNKQKTISTTLAIGIDFTQGSSISNLYVSGSTGLGLIYTARSIFVPFIVDEIIVKSIDSHFMSDIGLVNWTTSLLNGGTLGAGAVGSVVDLTNSCLSNVSYKFAQPIDVNGSYTFSYDCLDFAFRMANDAVHKPAGTAVFIIEFLNHVEHSSTNY